MTLPRSLNERHRRKRTVYHFAPLAHFVARFRSTAPFGRCVSGRSKLQGIDPKRMKQFRRIATRYEKKAENYLAMLILASIHLWL
ncbi:hypothetical protein B7486_53725 [cyanobacterium TDX16]|nr:hypothetical protein B7486_53725 [cyanobacterium TDX16]